MPYFLECSGGFVYINTACYYLGSTAVSWYAANATCNSLGAGVHLATISSTTEQAAIVAYYGTSTSMWIGLNCIATHATSGTTGEVWVWADGSTSTYTNWHIGEPNNAGEDDNNLKEDCLQITPTGLNDISCSAQTAFICEMNL